LKGSGSPSRFSKAANAAFGEPPPGPLVPETLAPKLAQVYRADLFRSAWPRFRPAGDSTSLDFDVREHGILDLAVAGGFDNDREGRVSATLTGRPSATGWPRVVRAGGAWRQFGLSGYAAIEPRSLDRGANGMFVRGGARRTETRIFDEDGLDREIPTERAEVLVGGQLRGWRDHVVQAGAGVGRVWSSDLAREGPMAALTLAGGGSYPRRLEAVAFGGTDRYASVRLALAAEVQHQLATLRPSLTGGWASEGAPLDELHGIGGPATLAGMRHDEWLGERALALEMRVVRRVMSGLDLDAYVQAGQVADAVSRVDLGERLHVAGGVGSRISVPFGPLFLDLGWSEGGRYRLDVSFGPEF
jgi:hypothetical protein